MKGSEKINKVLNRFLKNNGFELSAKLGTDFAYFYDKSEITYSLVNSERMNKLFKNYAYELGLGYDCGDFLLAFFHEIGHDQTMEDLDDDLEEECSLIKKTLSDTDKDANKYFRLYDERVATEWAIDYINNNKQKIQNFVYELAPAITDFLKINEVEYV